MHVVGDTYIQGTEYIFQSVNSTVGYLYFDHSGTQVWKQGIFNDNTSTFSIGNGGGFTRLFNITNAGNVGIGTTAPSGKLDIAHDMYTGAGNGVLQAGAYGSINFKGASSQGTTTTQQGITWQVDSYGGSINYGVQAQIAVGNNGNVGTFMGLFTSDNYSIPPVERIRIQYNGNIGIGTTSPTQRLHVSGSIAVENQGTTTIESTTFAGSVSSNTNIAFVPTGSFKAAFFDYYVASGSVNMRAGTVMAVHNNSTSRYTDTSTADIGTTAAVDFSTSVVGGNLVLTANIASGTWEIKTSYRAL